MKQIDAVCLVGSQKILKILQWSIHVWNASGIHSCLYSQDVGKKNLIKKKKKRLQNEVGDKMAEYKDMSLPLLMKTPKSQLSAEQPWAK